MDNFTYKKLNIQFSINLDDYHTKNILLSNMLILAHVYEIYRHIVTDT